MRCRQASMGEARVTAGITVTGAYFPVSRLCLRAVCASPLASIALPRWPPAPPSPGVFGSSADLVAEPCRDLGDGRRDRRRQRRPDREGQCPRSHRRRKIGGSCPSARASSIASASPRPCEESPNAAAGSGIAATSNRRTVPAGAPDGAGIDQKGRRHAVEPRDQPGRLAVMLDDVDVLRQHARARAAPPPGRRRRRRGRDCRCRSRSGGDGRLPWLSRDRSRVSGNARSRRCRDRSCAPSVRSGGADRRRRGRGSRR